MFILSSHGCDMCTHGHPHISGRGQLKTSSHFAVHIRVSPILTRSCCGKPSEVVPREVKTSDPMHAMSLLLNTCDGMTNRVLIDDGARWILQGDEQERENCTAGVKALYSMLASTTSGRATDLLKQLLSDRNGTIAYRRIRERFGKTAGVAKLSDVGEASEHDLVGRRRS